MCFSDEYGRRGQKAQMDLTLIFINIMVCVPEFMTKTHTF